MKGRPSEAPPWETARDGDHPAFKPLDKKEAEKLALAAIAEAQQFADGPAAKFMSDKQRFLANAERRRIHHKANMPVTEGEIREQHVRYLTEALLDLGRFDEAQVVSGMSSIGRSLDERAEEVLAACARPDDEDCGCERETTTVVQGGREIEVALDRRVALKYVFSPYHNDVVTLYRCRHCGMLNAMADPPARQAGREVAQKQIDRDTRHAIATGTATMLPAGDAQFLQIK